MVCRVRLYVSNVIGAGLEVVKRGQATGPDIGKMYGGRAATWVVHGVNCQYSCTPDKTIRLADRKARSLRVPGRRRRCYRIRSSRLAHSSLAI